jgi:hypothetical protein
MGPGTVPVLLASVLNERHSRLSLFCSGLPPDCKKNSKKWIDKGNLIFYDSK